MRKLDPWPLSHLFDRLMAAQRGEEPITPLLIVQARQAHDRHVSFGEPMQWIRDCLKILEPRWLDPTPDQATVAILQLEQIEYELKPSILDRWPEHQSDDATVRWQDVQNALYHFRRFQKKAAQAA